VQTTRIAGGCDSDGPELTLSRDPGFFGGLQAAHAHPVGEPMKTVFLFTHNGMGDAPENWPQTLAVKFLSLAAQEEEKPA